MLRRVLIVLVMPVLLGLLPGGASAAPCPNEALRAGPSASLPDCRAYELVTPASSGGRKIEPLLTGDNDRGSFFATELGSSDGDSFLFGLTAGALPESAVSNGTHDGYQAVRTTSGWHTVRQLTPSREQIGGPNVAIGGVSSAHEFASMLIQAAEPGQEGPLSDVAKGSGYLRDPDGSFQLVGIGSLGVERESEPRWISRDGRHVIFVTGGDEFFSAEKKQLEPDAPPTGIEAIYDRSALGGPTRVVSLLPGDVTPSGGNNDGRATYLGASEDGTAVAFKIGNGGGIYVRLDDSVTVAVPDAGASVQTFAGLSSNGERLTFVEDGDVFSYETQTEELQRASSVGDAEVVNVCADGSHVYFISHSQIAGEGKAGEPNLYVWGAASEETQFIATVSPGDVGSEDYELTNWTTRVFAVENPALAGPGVNGSRTNPSGSVIAFQSAAELTGYENAGHTEIYRYDTRDHNLSCVSCNSSGPATGDARLEFLNSLALNGQAVVHNLSDDGERIVFETEEALVPQDVDGVTDIYEWTGGTVPNVALITSGQTPRYLEAGPPNMLVAVTSNGENVFFDAKESLTAGAPTGGASEIYDARVDGGFAAAASTSCNGEGCQSAGVAPVFGGVPASVLYAGVGNVATVEAKTKGKTEAKGKAKTKRKTKAKSKAKSGKNGNDHKRKVRHRKRRRTVGRAHRQVGGGR